MTSLLLCATLLTSNVASTEMYDFNSSVINNIYEEDELTNGVIYTPKGSAVNVVSYNFDFTHAEREIIKNEDLEDYPNSIFISYATYRYNCHSYSFYSQNTSLNTWWLGDPTAYIEDGSYYETDGQIGDVVAYCLFDQIYHSGIIVDIIEGVPNERWNGLNLKIIESKWAYGPLFRHNGLECRDADVFLNSDEQEGFSIKYYRLHPQHSYTKSYVDFKNNKHKAYCECGEWRLENHVISGISPIYGTASCIYCGALVDTGFVQGYSVNNSFELINGLYYPVNTMYGDDLTYLSYEESMNYIEVEEYEK